ncbi:Maf family protein [Solimonas terrae]|uniref:7-methyl-GTP pyrophosphatase n=1 Tax=Solimonas terrae TaxID=1396819 RepID=A0A6M2BY63_9GAMM|nr:nucleoside triphosphate pyrophosphatase [Solimonas terrae]NGY06809.1 septum formation protein Maf [Solimonas terrae]
MAKSSSSEQAANAVGISAQTPLILASASRYRAELLARLQIDFVAEASSVDETARDGEDAAALTQRLARAKAEVLGGKHPRRWILGSDQAAALDERILGKPGDIAQAQAQLAACSGREVRFHTAVVLLQGKTIHRALDITTVRFRQLSAAEIERYVAAEPALDCAGSFKCEGYGISLFDAIESSDPTALIGLPLISVRRLLAQVGLARP